MLTRKATDADLSAIEAISRTTRWEKSDYLRRQLSLGAIDVAVENNLVVGFIVTNDEFFSKPFVGLIAVAPAHRRRGVGATLFTMTEARWSGNQLYTSTNRSNTAMHTLLKGRGYRVIGEIDLDPGDPEIFYRIDL